MNCLIIGYGSIGTRHANILKEMEHSVHVVSKRNVNAFPCYSSIKEALQNKNFGYVIISNETYKHYNSFMELNEHGYSGKLLIEKPVFLEPSSISQSDFENVFVAYNLRFHPVIQKLHEFLNGKEIYSIQVYVGQHLPSWRPSINYTKCYSASKAQGGGVLRDLSHELDYINWIAGGWKRVAAIGGKFSDLKIDSDDVFVLLLEMENCPVTSVQMNYLDRKAYGIIRTFLLKIGAQDFGLMVYCKIKLAGAISPESVNDMINYWLFANRDKGFGQHLCKRLKACPSATCHNHN